MIIIDKGKLLIDILKKWYMNLSKRDKIMSACALVMTIVLIISTFTNAWLAHQKRMAILAKINSPAKLSLRSGAGEDIIQFKMAGIDTESGNYKDFVFCVEGEDISTYNIQIAHTTNINFTYTVYQATPDINYDPANDTGGVEYITANRESVYYMPAGTPLSGAYINENSENFMISGNNVERKIGTTQYAEPSYINGASADARQKYAEPLYWQTSTAITADGTAYDIDSHERAFQNYYVLRVSWGSDVRNDKETDLIYITAQVS
ncbi:hypothetical protein SAMN02745111_01960 [Eubacterium uniforme]|uniref:Uncharacterized protein n=1 Tax=Eubacterium uniforme TaxID=39495 RepID=A0A1T4VYC4_9FIRM|nr:hypothetical protein [Eubacterium uniforme]SKA69996.1 hypothetical protein SAMN02745111_01960 [Eubacterium uniforme]HAV89809.1 hypothetical protein [Eubacterium sp.]